MYSIYLLYIYIWYIYHVYMCVVYAVIEAKSHDLLSASWRPRKDGSVIPV